MRDRSKSETTLTASAKATAVRRSPRRRRKGRATDWSSIPIQQVSDGVERQMIWGERLMVCRLRLAPHVVTPVHSHPHEQITIVERGRVRFVVGGTERVSSEGDVLHFPSRVEHGATMLDEEVVLIDIFSPVREDFLSENSL